MRKKHKAPKRAGRKRIKRKFEETRVGHFLKYEAPLEYDMIVNVASTTSAPTADLIEEIGYSSINPLFKKPKFRRALMEYRKHGLYSGIPRKSSIETEIYYIKLRKKLQII